MPNTSVGNANANLAVDSLIVENQTPFFDLTFGKTKTYVPFRPNKYKINTIRWDVIISIY